MAARQPPTPSEHAADRWAARADPIPDYEIEAIDDVDLWTAWVDAVPITLPRPWGLKGDETRYHPDATVLLCRDGDEIVTVYDLTGPDAHPVVRRAVEQQLDVTISEVN